MNVERIYQQHREEALAKQIASIKYSTFVAMPFRDTFSYKSKEIYSDVMQRAVEVANSKGTAARQFAVPHRADEASGQAVVITEEIIVSILESHLFVADITFHNAGVLLETGVALGLKPNRQIIILSQGTPEELHFDLRNNNIIFYQDGTAVEKLASAMIGAAAAFENEVKLYVGSVVRTLSFPAIVCLRWFGQVRKDSPDQALHEGVATRVFSDRTEGEAILLVQLATQELIQRRLFYMHFDNLGGDDGRWGAGGTELGWTVIDKLWPKYTRG